jgi:predicted ATPase/class 3 adenylate cyclase
MDFDEVLEKVTELLRRERRLSYRALKLRFRLDDEYIAALKEELIDAKHLAIDENGTVLVWTGAAPVSSSTFQISSSPPPPTPSSQSLDTGRRTADIGLSSGERRHLTVMFCDLVGSTALSTRLDPEDLHQLVQAYQHTCAEVITRYEGHIAQHLGDGILVYFGYPVAHEDDAIRAVRAGLEIVAEFQRQNVENMGVRGRVPLQVRIGIHTGQVMVGEVGRGERREQLALGDTPNIASRVQGQAEPNTVVISGDTYHLVQGFFTCQDLGPRDLKGVSALLSLYRVLGTGVAQSRFEVSEQRGLTPLVGRDEESELLARRWERAKAGQGQVVLLSGEAGIGKSRLAQVLREQSAADPQVRVLCQCSPFYQNSALYPLSDGWQRLLQFGREDTPDEKLGKLMQGLASLKMNDPETLALFAAFLAIPLPDAHPPLQLTPQKQKEKTLHSLITWLQRSAERQPVRLEIEDLHWADPSTLEWLGLLLDRVPGFRILVLLTFRPEFTLPWPAQAHVLPLQLSRLPQLQIAEMVERVAGKGLPREVLRQLISKSDGVPLYIEEMTKNVLESSWLTETKDRFEVSGPLPQLAIPATLHDAFAARLDRLAPVRELAQIGAVLGREFPYELIRGVSQMEDASLQDGLRRLVTAEIVFQRGLPPDATYTFKHALLQDTAYASLLKSQRQQLHVRAAQMLEQQFGEMVELHPELLAHHYTEAGLVKQALPYWQQAGQRANQRSAYAEAVTHLTKGLELLKTLPDTPERAQSELTLQIALGTALMATRGYAAPEVGQAFARARELCRQVGETPQLFPVLWGLSVFYVVRDELQTTWEVVEQLLRLAETVQDPRFLVGAALMAGGASVLLGELPRAREHLERGIALYGLRQHRFHVSLFGEDVGISCLCWEAFALWGLGYPEQALKRVEEALTLAQEFSHPFSLAYAISCVARLHQFRQETQATQAQVDTLLALAAEQGFTLRAAQGTILRGWALAMQAQREEGIAQLRQGLRAFRATGAEFWWPAYLALLAEAYGEVGRYEEGLNTVAEALDAVNKTGERFYEAELYRLKGTLTLQKLSVASIRLSETSGVGNAHHHVMVAKAGTEGAAHPTEEEAEACFLKALEIARQQQAKSLELRAATSLARRWHQQGKTAEARALLMPVYQWFTEGFDTKDLQEAKALLEALT